MLHLEMKSKDEETLNALSDCIIFLSFHTLPLFLQYLFFCAIVPPHPAHSLLHQSLRAKDSHHPLFNNIIFAFFFFYSTEGKA